MKKIFRNIQVCKLLNGYELSLTLHEFSCDKPGPTLGLSATIHGDEDLPIEILRQFSLELENLDFKGRVFPGSKRGTVSEQIAHAIVTEYIPQADYFLDFHSGGAVPTVEYLAVYPKGEELAKMLGLK